MSVSCSSRAQRKSPKYKYTVYCRKPAYIASAVSIVYVLSEDVWSHHEQRLPDNCVPATALSSTGSAGLHYTLPPSKFTSC